MSKTDEMAPGPIPVAPEMDWDSMREVQVYVNDWARRTFPGRNPKASLTKLTMEEIPELLIHLKLCGSSGIADELADCFILLLDLAEIWKINLARAILDKMQINERRMWTKDEDLGHWNHAHLQKKPTWACRFGQMHEADEECHHTEPCL